MIRTEHIRLGAEGDAEKVLAIDLVADRDAGRRALLQESIDSKTCWIAESNGSILGFVVLEYTFYGNGFIPLLVVAEGSRRQGIGEQLLLHAVSKCETRKLFTSTNESNHAMRNLLGKAGFEPSGIIHNLDEGDPELVFVRRS